MVSIDSALPPGGLRAPAQPGLGIAQLPFVERFVGELPGDPRSDRQLREVRACYSRVVPTAVARPELLVLVPEVCALLGLDPAPTPELAAILGGNRVVPGMAPYAACYGGHQFGTWAGQLGDGRAITLAEVQGPGDKIWEVQLKGAGPTPYSRRADGRAVMRSSIRELVCSEAMYHLGVPTTRALSLVATGEEVERDLLYDGHPRFEPGAIVCRVAPTFLRFGSFEIHAARDDRDTLDRLVTFALAQFFPHHEGDVVAMFAEIAERTAWMVCEWMRVGFVHGVMNTDNMSILGLTIDYGPYGWLEPFDLDWTPNTTDAGGRRYRFGHQPRIAHWNLARFARALAPVVPPARHAELERVLARFVGIVDDHFHNTMLRKLGLVARPGDDVLLAELGNLLVAHETDMTLFFRRLAHPLAALPDALVDSYYGAPDAVVRAQTRDWLETYAARVRAEDLDDETRRARMDAINPLYVPRNYLVQQVIEATEAGDGGAAIRELLDVLRDPYREEPGRERFAGKRPAWARDKPGCSMLSCSS